VKSFLGFAHRVSEVDKIDVELGTGFGFTGSDRFIVKAMFGEFFTVLVITLFVLVADERGASSGRTSWAPWSSTRLGWRWQRLACLVHSLPRLFT